MKLLFTWLFFLISTSECSNWLGAFSRLWFKARPRWYLVWHLDTFLGCTINSHLSALYLPRSHYGVFQKVWNGKGFFETVSVAWLGLVTLKFAKKKKKKVWYFNNIVAKMTYSRMQRELFPFPVLRWHHKCLGSHQSTCVPSLKKIKKINQARDLWVMEHMDEN